MAQQLVERPHGGVPAAVRGSQSTFLRWAGYSGLLASLAFLATGIVANVFGIDPPAGPGEIGGYLRDVSQAAGSFYTYGVAGIVLTVLYVPMAVGVHRLLGRTPAAWFGTAAVVTGLAVLFPAYVISILVPAGLASAAADVGDAGAVSLYVTYAHAEAAAAVCFAVGSVLSLGLGPLLWGYAWLRAHDSGRWLGWVGVIVGVTGMVWFSPGLDTAILLVVLAVNVLVALVYFTGVSLVLVSAGRARR